MFRFTTVGNRTGTFFVDDIRIEDTSDTEAPVTTVAASPIDGRNGWYVTNPVIGLQAKDNGPGAVQSFYRINGEHWAAYTSPVLIEQEGINVFEYYSVDAAGNKEERKAMTVKLDKTAPELHVSLDKDLLWPPNHKMVTVTATVYAKDAVSQIDHVILASAESNEPDDGLGDGDTPNDIQGADIGTLDHTVMLRAERSGNGSGRVYTLVYKAVDQAGNISEVPVKVVVPRD